MSFEEWWKTHDYSEHHKEECREAFEAGCEDNFHHANREINNRDAIINFLKKELIKKSAFKNVMKRQYRELRQKYDNLCNMVSELYDKTNRNPNLVIANMIEKGILPKDFCRRMNEVS